MQEETEVLGENLRGQVWIENQIHIRLWPDWESNPGRIGERHGNNRCAARPLEVLLQNFSSKPQIQYCEPLFKKKKKKKKISSLSPIFFCAWPFFKGALDNI